MESLRLLNETDLEKLGVLLGHRKKLPSPIATLGPEQVIEPPSAEPATRRLVGDTFELTELGACILKGSVLIGLYGIWVSTLCQGCIADANTPSITRQWN